MVSSFLERRGFPRRTRVASVAPRATAALGRNIFVRRRCFVGWDGNDWQKIIWELWIVIPYIELWILI